MTNIYSELRRILPHTSPYGFDKRLGLRAGFYVNFLRGFTIYSKLFHQYPKDKIYKDKIHIFL